MIELGFLQQTKWNFCISYPNTRYSSSSRLTIQHIVLPYTETEMSSYWPKFRDRLHRKQVETDLIFKYLLEITGILKFKDGRP